MVRPVLAGGVLLAACIMSSLAWAPAARTGAPPRAKAPAGSGVAAAAVAAHPDTRADYPGEKIRKALDQVINLEFDKQPLSQVVERLQKATKVPFAIDHIDAQPTDGGSSQEHEVTAKLEHVKLRDGLHTMLAQYNLGYAIVGGKVLITTACMAIERQVGQLVRVNLEEIPLDKALQRLGRETATNILLDQRAVKEGQTKISMQLEDVPLETAVRLMAEMANLKPERMANVLFVTTPARATQLRTESSTQPQAGQGPLVIPGLGALGAIGLGGIGGLGAAGIGGLGAGGIGGAGLGGNLGVAGGCAGLSGCGGGAQGIGGGIAPAGPTPAKRARDKAALKETAATVALALVEQEQRPDKKAHAKPKAASPAAPKAEPPARVALNRVTRMGMRTLVDKPITADFPPGATMKDALEYLQERSGVPILIDEQAWKDDPDLKDQFPEGILNQPVKLPKMVGVRLATVLWLVLEPTGGDFQVRPNFIMVVTHRQVTSGHFLRQRVDATFENVPLEDVLERLATVAGVSIVLDSRAAKTAAHVTASFKGLPLETAVRMLADMAGLKSVRLDNGLYVTSKGNAALLQDEEEERKLAMPKAEPVAVDKE